MDERPVRLDIYRTSIPIRGFAHAAAVRDTADAVVLRLELADGRAGWGETLPRTYVTGETIDTVVADMENVLWPQYARDPAATLPLRTGGRIINAAACGLELAHLDATNGFAEISRRRIPIGARVSGVLGSADPTVTARRLRLMRWFGLRDFKLKLGLGEHIDAENLRVVFRRIGGSVASGRCTLRVDVNGGWDADSTPQRTADLKPYGVCVVEQPVFCPAQQLVEIASRCELPLMADESLLTDADARALLDLPQSVWWNIRISKNGGLRRAMELAELAAENDVPFTVGCMVGESGILSAAQRRLLQLISPPRFVEGNYGKLLLTEDLTSPSLRFGYGGRIKPMKGPGLGVRVDPRSVVRYGELLRTLTGDPL